MTRSTIDLSTLLARMSELQDEGDRKVREGTALVTDGQQRQADARKIREAILVVVPDYKFDAPQASPGTAAKLASVDTAVAAVDLEDGLPYGYWTGIVYDTLVSLGGTGSVRQVIGSIRRSPDFARHQHGNVKVSVRNAMRSLLRTGRVKKGTGAAGVVYTAIKRDDEE